MLVALVIILLAVMAISGFIIAMIGILGLIGAMLDTSQRKPGDSLLWHLLPLVVGVALMLPVCPTVLGNFDLQYQVGQIFLYLIVGIIVLSLLQKVPIIGPLLKWVWLQMVIRPWKLIQPTLKTLIAVLARKKQDLVEIAGDVDEFIAREVVETEVRIHGKKKKHGELEEEGEDLIIDESNFRYSKSDKG